MRRFLVALLALASMGCSLFQDQKPPKSSCPREISVNEVPKDEPHAYRKPGVNSKQGVVWREDDGYGYLDSAAPAASKAGHPATAAEKVRDASKKLFALPNDLLAPP
jgi:hypothetical protein